MVGRFGLWWRDKGENLNREYVATALARRADLQMELRSYSAAITLAQKALRIREQYLPGTEYMPLAQLGRALTLSGQRDAAVECFRRAVEVVEREFYRDHPLVAPILDRWASCYIQGNQLEKAEKLISRSLEIKERCQLHTDCDTVETMRTLGEIRRLLGKYAEAEVVLKKALPLVASSTIGPVEEFQYELALVYLDQGRLAEAEALLTPALDTFAGRAGKNRRFAMCLQTFADLLARQGRNKEAAKLKNEAEAILSNTNVARQPAENVAGPLYFERDLYPSTILH